MFSKTRTQKLPTSLFVVVGFFALSFLVNLVISSTTHAAFNPGNIINNATFTNYNSMNAAQIQTFLNNKNSVCLKDFRGQSLVDDNGDGVVQDSTTESYGRHGTMSAAEIINAAAKIYKINPQVILVTLQKEQGLITRGDCPQWRYNTALGYGCPDTAPCDNSAFGFTRQIDYGTYHFRGYFDDTMTYVPFGTGNHYIGYNPDSSCGGSVVNIQNRATASLYSYTPYQPNAAALAAGYGEAPCGAYGNRNFYLFFTSWFGSTTSNRYSDMLEKRVMTIDTSSLGNATTYKINPDTGETYYDTPIASGSEIYFYSKTDLEDGSACLRTKADSLSNANKCIKIDRIKEWSPVFEDVTQAETTALATQSTYKVDFKHDSNQYEYNIRPGDPLALAKKVTVAGQVFYITQKDFSENNSWRGIKMGRFKALSSIFDNFQKPRYMRTNKQVKITDLSINSDSANILEANTHLLFNKKAAIGENVFYTSDYLLGMGQYYAVSSKQLSDGISFQNFVIPRNMKLNTNTYKYSLDTNNNIDDLLLSGRVIHFSQKIKINNKEYYRTTTDKANGYRKVIESSRVSEL